MPGPTPMLRFTFITAIAATLTFPAQSHAQQKSLSIGFGYSSLHQYNRLASPLKYSGGGVNASLAFTNETARRSWGIHLAVDNADNTSSITQGTNHTGASTRAQLSVPYTRRIASVFSNRVTIGAGAQMVAELVYHDQTYGQVVPSEPYADAFAGVDAMLRWSAQFGPRTRIVHDIAVPAARMVWRTSYAGLKYQPDAELALPDRLTGIDSRFSVVRRLGSRVAGRLHIDMSSLTDRGTWDIELGAQRVGIGFDWLIGNGER